MILFLLFVGAGVLPAQRSASPQVFVEHSPKTKTPRLQVLTGTAGLNPATSFAMASLIFRSAKSEATRNEFLMSFAFDDPWVIKQTPFTPSNGAPPYSVWS